jgi:4-carboxymuconolactone decarboxylase
VTRFAILSRAEMNAEQGEVYDDIEKEGGRLGGPYWALIRIPKFMRLHQDMGTYLRECALSVRERQIAVLTTVRHWGGKYPWAAQVRASLQVGLDEATIAAINRRETPKLTDTRERLAHEVAKELLATKGLSEATYAAAEKAYGLTQLTDLVAAIGYFTMLCCTANAFDITPPDAYPARLAP